MEPKRARESRTLWANVVMFAGFGSLVVAEVTPLVYDYVPEEYKVPVMLGMGILGAVVNVILRFDTERGVQGW